MLMRGGTSKGPFFVADELPSDPAERDQLILGIMGSPDSRQIDGVGGAHPLTSKAAVVSPSDSADADLDYLFLQVGVDSDMVTDRQNCGNMLAGVGPFAVERGLVQAEGDEASVRILMRNNGGLARSTFRIRDGMPVYDGDTAISGVPGTASGITLEFLNTAGSSCGSLLPTGNATDMVDGVEATLIDNGMPVVVIRASDLGITGYESCAELEANQVLRDRVEAIRLSAGELMNLGDVSMTSIPKMSMVAPPLNGGSLSTRSFIPHKCHASIGVLGAVSVATAALIPGSPASEVARIGPDSPIVTIEHPSGSIDTKVEVTVLNGKVTVGRAGVISTARKLMDGLVFPRGY